MGHSSLLYKNKCILLSNSIQDDKLFHSYHEVNGFNLIGYSHSNWAGSCNDKKSTTDKIKFLMNLQKHLELDMILGTIDG